MPSPGSQECRRCGGGGRTAEGSCPRCGGTGTYAYLPWADSGGPDECAHGRAAGIACPECDAWEARHEERGAASGAQAGVPRG